MVDGRISLGAFVAFNGYLAYLAWPTVALGWTLAIVRRGMTSMERIAEVLDSAPAASDRPDPAPGAAPPRALVPPGAIEFRGLTFAYPGREPTLRDVSFTSRWGAWWRWWGRRAAASPPGRADLPAVRAARGNRDGGRTWTCASCPRPRCGGASATSRRRLSLLPVLRDNIRLATRRRVRGAVVRAAALTAGLTEEVDALAGGWDTVVGERVSRCRRQRQRAALARALLGDPAY